jgi:hypothetical protein
MKICPRCDDDATDEPRDHSEPCRIKGCNSQDHSACEH